MTRHKWRKSVAIVVSSVLLLMTLFPPFEYGLTESPISLGYAPVWSTKVDGVIAKVNTSLLLIQILVFLITSGAIYIAFDPVRSSSPGGNDSQATPPPSTSSAGAGSKPCESTEGAPSSEIAPEPATPSSSLGTITVSSDSALWMSESQQSPGHDAVPASPFDSKHQATHSQGERRTDVAVSPPNTISQGAQSAAPTGHVSERAESITETTKPSSTGTLSLLAASLVGVLIVKACVSLNRPSADEALRQLDIAHGYTDEQRAESRRKMCIAMVTYHRLGNNSGAWPEEISRLLSERGDVCKHEKAAPEARVLQEMLKVVDDLAPSGEGAAR